MILKYAKKLTRKVKNNPEKPSTSPNSSTKTPISMNLGDNLQAFQNAFKSNSDVNIREFYIGKTKKQAFLVNIEGLSDKTIINENILGTLMTDFRKINIDYEINITNLKENALNVYSATILNTIEDAFSTIVTGNTAIFLDGESSALEIATRAYEHRNVDAPQTENVVRGPHEGFTEALRTNTALVRRKIQNPDLKIEHMKIGRRTATEVAVLYVDSLVNKKILEEVKQRLADIDIDSILDSGYIEELIEDAPLTTFPTIGNTEKPDKLAAKILEGRVGIIVDGSPMALTIPYLFIESFQDTEDYYSRSFLTSFIRILRFISAHITLFLPALYVALSNFHPNVIPRRLLSTMQASHEGIPFPSAVEAILMTIVFEILREAGVRMPRPVGEAVSIVGALVMGEVAVNAGLVSPLMVIIVASTGVMSFLLPPQIGAVTLLRYPILAMAAAFGLFGVVWSYIFIIIHLCSLRSFGTPYLSPITPVSIEGLKDFLFRVPWWMKTSRPKSITWRKSERIAPDSKPGPDKNKEKG